MALLPVDDALRRLLADAEPISEAEIVSLHEGYGRVLTQDLIAARTQPPFAASAMDGYAVRAADIADAPVELRLIGQSAAGHGFAGELRSGEAVRILTGAPVPAGADTILIQENSERTGDRLRVLDATAKGRHIREAGLDFREGEMLIPAGSRMDAGRLTLAAAMNQAVLSVRRRPVVAILATGDELVRPGEVPGPDQIVASNTYGVAAIVHESGGIALDLGIVADRTEAIAEAVDRSEAAGADILVTLGGASVGDHDLVQPALTARGMTLDFWKVAMRPGKPLMFGRLAGRRVLELPGNPVSTLVCAHLFLRPLVRRLAGLPAAERRRSAVLGSAMAENDHRRDYVRARLSLGDDGTLIAWPFGRQDSSMMKTFALADCLIVREANTPAAAAGETCAIELLREPD